MNEQYYCLHLDDYSTPAFISYGKSYYGTMEDLQYYKLSEIRMEYRPVDMEEYYGGDESE